MLSPVRLDIDPVQGSPFPLDLAIIKQHCNVGGTEFDDLLEAYTLAAVDWAESYMNRTIFSRSHSWILRDFPQTSLQMMRLPRGKTRSVESIAYVAAGQTVTLTGPSSGSPAGDDWQEDLGGNFGAVLMPPKGTSWPSVDYDTPAPVTVTFTAGWDAADIPKEILHGIWFAVSDAFDLRGTSDLSDAGVNLMRRQNLLSGYRLLRFY